MVLNLLQVFLVLVEFFFKHIGSVYLGLEVHLIRGDFLINLIKPFCDVIVRCLRSLLKLLDFLRQCRDLLHSCLELLDERILRIRSLLCLVGDHLDLRDGLGMLLVLRLEVVGERGESFSACRLNLERFKLLQCVGLVHSLYDCVDITEHLFLQNLSVVRQLLQKGGQGGGYQLTCLGAAFSGGGVMIAESGLIIWYCGLPGT